MPGHPKNDESRSVNWGQLQFLTFLPFMAVVVALFILGRFWPVYLIVGQLVGWMAAGTLIVEGLALRNKYEWWWVWGLAVPLMLLFGGLGLGL